MQSYESFHEFWEYAQSLNRGTNALETWTLAHLNHTSDTEYMKKRSEGRDELGFQPLFLTYVHAKSRQIQRIVVKHVVDDVANRFRIYARELYMHQLSQRFASFRPDEIHAFTEYDNWEEFYDNWLQSQGQPIFDFNVPLIFDHTPKLEYIARKQSGQRVLPYQRMLVTTYFVSSNQFYDFFIKHVNDDEARRIKLIVQSRFDMHAQTLYGNEAS
jgi:hypothetical protein